MNGNAVVGHVDVGSIASYVCKRMYVGYRCSEQELVNGNKLNKSDYVCLEN